MHEIARSQSVAIDRTTAADLLPMLVSKAIPGCADALPERNAILAAERTRLGRVSLSHQEIRQVLVDACEYTDRGFVYRDFGDYCVGVSTGAGVRISGKPSALCYRVAHAVLAEVYLQKTAENVVIRKDRLLRQHLGYGTGEKQAYAEVWEALDSLRKFEYVVRDYNFTHEARIAAPGRVFSTGNFIYNLTDTGREYIVSVNPNFVGCVRHVMDDNKRIDQRQRPALLQRGYFHMPVGVLPMMKHCMAAACLLTHFLLRDSGNRKIACAQGEKAVAYAIPRFIQEAGIRRAKPARAYRHFLEALRQCPIVLRTEPGVDVLARLRPAKITTQVLRVYVAKRMAAAPASPLAE